MVLLSAFRCGPRFLLAPRRRLTARPARRVHYRAGRGSKHGATVSTRYSDTRHAPLRREGWRRRDHRFLPTLPEGRGTILSHAADTSGEADRRPAEHPRSLRSGRRLWLRDTPARLRRKSHQLRRRAGTAAHDQRSDRGDRRHDAVSCPRNHHLHVWTRRRRRGGRDDYGHHDARAYHGVLAQLGALAPRPHRMA